MRWLSLGATFWVKSLRPWAQFPLPFHANRWVVLQCEIGYFRFNGETHAFARRREDFHSHRDFLGALGPLKIIEQLRPSYARRYNRRLLDLSMGYSEHELQNGTEAALDWLIKEVSEPRLPDLRRGKSASDDWTLNHTLAFLTAALAPVFRETTGHPRTRLTRIEPIVSEVLKRPWKPTHAMTGKEPLMAFCYDVLGVSAARVSQARARYKGAIDKMLKRMIARANMRMAAGLPFGDPPGPIAQAWKYQRLLGIKSSKSS